ncbi:hypothetical protein J2S56_000120 [Corynebacterium lowii]|nr:hypothetical protein [Corynebacterium lowii]
MESPSSEFQAAVCRAADLLVVGDHDEARSPALRLFQQGGKH